MSCKSDAAPDVSKVTTPDFNPAPDFLDSEPETKRIQSPEGAIQPSPGQPAWVTDAQFDTAQALKGRTSPFFVLGSPAEQGFGRVSPETRRDRIECDERWDVKGMLGRPFRAQRTIGQTRLPWASPRAGLDRPFGRSNATNRVRGVPLIVAPGRAPGFRWTPEKNANSGKSARRGHRLLFLPGIVLGAILVSAGCASKETAGPEPVATVQVATVEQKTIQQVVTADAVLYPLNEAPIVPKITAPIRKFYVHRGSEVHAGELVAVLENKDLSAAVVQSQGAYNQAQAAYITSTEVNVPATVQKAQLDVRATRQAMQSARLVYQSRLKLYQAGAIARNLMDQSHVAYIQARNQYEIALANLRGLQSVGKAQQIKAAEGQLTSAQGSYLAAQAQYDYSEIRSPISGVVTDRPLYEGEMASAGSPLMTVMNISHVVARAHMSPQQAYLLRVGDPATISVGGEQAGVPGKISVVSPALDPNSTTVQVWVDAPNPAYRLKPGATVMVSMIAKTVKDALVIPASAVLAAPDGSTSVMVVGSDDKAHTTDVKAGIREGDEVQVLSGLQPGERVVTEGAYGLPDGTKVKW